MEEANVEYYKEEKNNSTYWTLPIVFHKTDIMFVDINTYTTAEIYQL